MEIVVLGTAHGRPIFGRLHTSIALRTGEDLYLLDCGEPCAAGLHREALDPHRVRAAFVSHMHPDHSCGLFMLLKEMHLGRRETPFTLCLPEEAIEPLRQFLPHVYCAPELLNFPLTLSPIRPEASVWADGNLSLKAHRNSHLWFGPSGARDDGAHSFSFVAHVEGKRIVWTGDVPRTFDELGPLLQKPTDLLLSELTHMDPAPYFEFLGQFDVGTVLFHHVYEKHFEDFNDFGPMLARASAHLKAKVHIAHDGYRMVL